MKKILFFICFILLLMLTSCQKSDNNVRLNIEQLKRGYVVCYDENIKEIKCSNEEIFKKVKYDKADVYLIYAKTFKLNYDSYELTNESEIYIYKYYIFDNYNTNVYEVDFISYGEYDVVKKQFIPNGNYDIKYSLTQIPVD